MFIRKYKSSDCEYLAELFYQTVHAVNAKDYTREQLNAWASGRVDLAEWDRTLSAHDTVVAVEDDKIVGFGDMSRTGYLDRLYATKIIKAGELRLLFVVRWKRLSVRIKLQCTLPSQQNRFSSQGDIKSSRNNK